MNVKSLFPKEGPEIVKEEDPNFAILHITADNNEDLEIYIEKDEVRTLMESSTNWLIDVGRSWYDVKKYEEKHLSDEEIAQMKEESYEFHKLSEEELRALAEEEYKARLEAADSK